VVADFLRRLEQDRPEARTYACQARAYAHMACAHLTRMQQEVQRAYRHTLAASLTLWMPTADPWTRDITATILLRHGLLADKPAGPRPAGPRPWERAAPDDAARFP
jgi:hypothetical protein